MSKTALKQPKEKLRVSAAVVIDATALDRARAKADKHSMPFEVYLENAVRLYGKYLDKKVSVIALPI